jgi:N6-L-threonylcarbamoyladenine synthase
LILGLESSCDETAVALFDPGRGLAGEWIRSQVALHAGYGGVVPDLATREHLRWVAPLLREAGLASDGFRAVTQVAVTHGPGLAGCLAIGVAAAKALAFALRCPLLGVNHLRAHAYSPFIPEHAAAPETFAERWCDLAPHLGLIVSGGNTLLLRIGTNRRIEEIAGTRDDAAGEALDKGAKLLGLGYPGGPLVEREAQGGDPAAFDFPRGLAARSELEFSFSGLKTSLRYRLERMAPGEIEARRSDLCASYQEAVIGALVRKTEAALAAGEFRSLGLSGGVANNRHLRAAFADLARRHGVPLLAARPEHTGDNAGMIAFAAACDPEARPSPLPELGIHPGLALAESPPRPASA